MAAGGKGKAVVKAGSRAPSSPGKRGPGRPSAYSLELADRICLRIAQGETLIEICEDADMPAEATVRGWDWDDRNGRITAAQGFSTLYARACELRIEHEMDRLRVVTTKPQLGVTRKTKQMLNQAGKIITLEEYSEGDAVQARALEADGIKWRIARMSAIYLARAPLPAPKGPEDGTSEDNKIIVEGGLPDDDDEMDEAPGIDEEPPEDIEP